MARPTFRGEKPLDRLIAIATKRHLAKIVYRKGVTSADSPVRLVEPYGLTQGKQDAMVKCYQLEPQEGWRYFMIHKLDSVVDARTCFKPRSRVTLGQVTVTDTYEKDPNWTPPLKQYRNLVSDALADGKLTRSELKEIDRFKAEHRIAIAQIRFVHASIFHRCLGAVLDDGVVDDGERAQIRFLNKVLARLGWTIGD